MVDTQEGFYGAARADVDRTAFALVVARVAWLTGVAAAFGVPVVVTEEDPGLNGPTAPAILARLPAGSPVLAKPVFAAGHDPAIRAALEATGRGTVVVAGLETDVCVAHSALSLRADGLAVAAVADALYSPGEAHEHGLARLRAEGVQLLSAKAVFYDWARTLADARAVLAEHPELAEPPGFSL